MAESCTGEALEALKLRYQGEEAVDFMGSQAVHRGAGCRWSTGPLGLAPIGRKVLGSNSV